jgi:hypothetical protein
MRSFLLAAMLVGCASDTEPQTIDLLSDDSKADGLASAVVTLVPDERALLQWLCSESIFELNGCTIKMTITTADPKLTPDATIGVLVHKDLNTKRMTEHPVHVGDTLIAIQAATISAHSAELTNTSSASRVFIVNAKWK